MGRRAGLARPRLAGAPGRWKCGRRPAGGAGGPGRWPPRRPARRNAGSGPKIKCGAGGACGRENACGAGGPGDCWGGGGPGARDAGPRAAPRRGAGLCLAGASTLPILDFSCPSKKRIVGGGGGGAHSRRSPRRAGRLCLLSSPLLSRSASRSFCFPLPGACSFSLRCWLLAEGQSTQRASRLVLAWPPRRAATPAGSAA